MNSARLQAFALPNFSALKVSIPSLKCDGFRGFSKLPSSCHGSSVLSASGSRGFSGLAKWSASRRGTDARIRALDLQAAVGVWRLSEAQEKRLEDDKEDNVEDGIVSKVLEILKAEDKFRYHKVPKLKALRLTPAPAMVLRVLRAKEVKPSHAWKFFLWTKKQMGYKHTAEAYNAIIPTLLEMRKFTSVYHIMEDMYKEGVTLSPETCVKMAKAFGSAGMVERAVQALNHMSRLGSPATTRHLNSVVAELLKSRHHYKACIVYREMGRVGCEPDGHTFKLILRELAKVEKLDLACHVFDAMKARGCEPDLETASVIVGILCQAGRVEEALLVFEKVKRMGVRQNARVYSSLLNGLGKAGDGEKALQILEEMRVLGFYPDRHSVAALIDVLVTSGREEDAQRCRVYLASIR